MQLYKTTGGNILVSDDRAFRIATDWDALINQKDLYKHLADVSKNSERLGALPSLTADAGLQPPIGTQEVWASGVTYLRSRDARMEESKGAGGSDFYHKVYDADRPELFFKALPQRVVGSGVDVFIRKDSTWNVPEPELTLYINRWGEIQGYTIGNDMSSRSIEGENPLYLPQAKSYERSCALGPCLLVLPEPISPETNIRIAIQRQAKEVFGGVIQLNRMKRTLPELAGWLYRECLFPHGCFLMTGTGVVPDSDFTLVEGDEISISIDGIGALVNRVATWKM